MFGFNSLAKLEGQRYSPENEETGLENILIGEIDAKKYERIAKRDDFVDLEESINLAESCQAGNPEKPEKDFAKGLLEKISREFGEDYTAKFFVSAGISHLDVLHGVDCFFKLYDKASQEEAARALIDLSDGKDKEKGKADVLLNLDHDKMKRYFPNGHIEGGSKPGNDLLDDYSEIISLALRQDMERRQKDREKIAA